MESEHIEFETPENVQVRYQPAGLGTRFLAWLADELLFWLILLVIVIVLMFAAQGVAAAFSRIFRESIEFTPGQSPQVPFYFVGIITLIIGLGSFAYFGLSEYLLRGQTFGKRRFSLRVVNVNGFSLNAGCIFMRNIFRIIDHLPVLWIVPFVSKRSQRLGDMVAGTIIVVDQTTKMSGLRERLLKRSAAEIRFHFDNLTLQRARTNDIEAIEKILERWRSVKQKQKKQLLAHICDPLAKRLQVEPPEPENRLRFLLDFLAAEYRRQYRQLG